MGAAVTVQQSAPRRGVLDRVRGRFRGWRERRPWLDHAVRAYDRNSEARGSQLAAGITYFGFLSFFPLIALGFAVVGYLSAGDPQLQRQVTDAVQSAFPSLIGTGDGKIDIQDVIDAKAGAGLVGLLGLLYSGLGWLDALRDALRQVFGTSDLPLAFVRKKVVDVALLAGLGAALLASVLVTSVATAVTRQVLDLAGLGDSSAAVALLKALTVALGLLADTLLFAILLSRLAGARLPWRQVRGGGLLAAVGFEVLKLLATFLISRTTTNPLYATFGVVVGLLVWINFVARLLVFAAAWAATQPYSLEPAPAGEAGAGRSTGLAAGTEPVSVVAPADFEGVPGAVAADPADVRRRGCRRAALGAVVGAGVVAAVARSRRATGG